MAIRGNAQHIFILLEVTPDREADSFFAPLSDNTFLDTRPKMIKTFVHLCEGLWVALLGTYQDKQW